MAKFKLPPRRPQAPVAVVPTRPALPKAPPAAKGALKALPRADVPTILAVKELLGERIKQAGSSLAALALLDEFILEANSYRESLRAAAAAEGYRSALDGRITIND